MNARGDRDAGSFTIRTAVLVLVTAVQSACTQFTPLPTSYSTSCQCASDRSSLESLFHATNGPRWNTPWDVNDTNGPCTWAGVTCDAVNGHVTNVTLESFGLSGSLPAEFATRLSAPTSMLIINLRNNNITGTLPSAFGRLTGLTWFTVSHNQLIGTLPVECASWTHLTRFDVSFNSLMGPLPNAYSAWTSLTAIDVSYNQLNGTLPPNFSAWSSIVTVAFAGNKFSGSLPPEWKSWTSILFLYAGENELTGTLPPEYKTWSQNLVYFYVNLNRLSGTLPTEYAAWAAIGEIKVSGNQLTGSLPSDYSALQTMTEFRAENNSLSGTLPPQYGAWGAGFSCLAVTYNFFTGTIPPQYALWSNLTRFSVGLNNIGGSFSSQILWPQLELFVVSHNALTGSLPKAILSLKSITLFAAVFNNFQGTLPKQISAAVLDVQNNPMVTGNPPSGPLLFTLCGTGICLPKTSSLFPFQSCLPEIQTLPYSQSSAVVFATMQQYPFACEEPNIEAALTSTLTTSLPDNIVVSEVALDALSDVLLPFSAPFLVAATMMSPDGGAALIMLGTSACASPGLEQSTELTRFVLSPFYSFGAAVAVLGNIGLCLAFAGLHAAAVMWGCPAATTLRLRFQRGNHHRHERQRRKKVANVSASIHARSTLRFPHYSIVVVSFFARGISFYGASLLNANQTIEGEWTAPLRLIAIIAACLWITATVVASIVAPRRSAALKTMAFVPYTTYQLTYVSWISPSLLPLGRWIDGTDTLRQRYGAFRDLVCADCESCAFPLGSGLAIANAIIIGVVPASVGGCIGGAVTQVSVLAAAVALVVAKKPMRVPCAGWLRCATWFCDATVAVCLAIARSSHVDNQYGAAECIAAISIVHGCVGVTRLIHSVILWWWQRSLPTASVRRSAIEAQSATLLGVAPSARRSSNEDVTHCPRLRGDTDETNTSAAMQHVDTGVAQQKELRLEEKLKRLIELVCEGRTPLQYV